MKILVKVRLVTKEHRIRNRRVRVAMKCCISSDDSYVATYMYALPSDVAAVSRKFLVNSSADAFGSSSVFSFSFT